MEPIFWLILFVVFIIMEIITLGLTTIWFAAGSLVAFIVSLLGAGRPVQIILFFAVSILMLYFTRPWAKKFINQKATRTNAEDLKGRTAKVISEINNHEGSGQVMINGLEWTARATNDDDVISEGKLVKVVNIQGVKLIVEEIKVEKREELSDE